MQLRPAILSCGFFQFDCPLGLSIVATITSYLIIICQFRSPVQEKTNPWYLTAVFTNAAKPKTPLNFFYTFLRTEVKKWTPSQIIKS